MNRHILAGMFGLALAGCAQTRPAMPTSSTGSSPPSVAPAPESNISDMNNRENGPVVATPAAAPAVPSEVPATSKIPELAVRPTSGANGEAGPASGRVPGSSADPLLGTDPDVVPLPAPAPSPDAAPGAVTPDAIPAAAGMRP